MLFIFRCFSKFTLSFILHSTYDNLWLVLRMSIVFVCSIIAVHQKKNKLLIILLLDILVFFQPLVDESEVIFSIFYLILL